MGYESRLYVVRKSNLIEDGKRWAEVIAMIDMCKLGAEFGFELHNYTPTDCCIYIGDNKVTEDMYGDPLIEIPVKDMLSILATLSRKEDYRRFAPAINLLNGFNLSEWQVDGEDLVVLHYGY